MEKLNPVIKYLNKSYGIYNVKGVEVEPRYWMAVTLIILAFLVLFTLARLRYLYVHWNLGKSAISMLFWGFVLALLLEATLLLFGKTMFTSVLGWKQAPKPISTILAIGRKNLIDVLGDEDINYSLEEMYSPEELNQLYSNLPSKEAEVFREMICK